MLRPSRVPSCPMARSKRPDSKTERAARRTRRTPKPSSLCLMYAIAQCLTDAYIRRTAGEDGGERRPFY
jgi:hypothetical protein